MQSPQEGIEPQKLNELQQELAALQKDVQEIKELLQQGKGMARMLQILFYVVGPVVATIYWIKDHVR